MPSKGSPKLKNFPIPTSDEAAASLLSALRSELAAKAERIAKDEAKACIALLNTLEENVSELQSNVMAAKKKKQISPAANKTKKPPVVVQTTKRSPKGNIGGKRKKAASEGLFCSLLAIVHTQL